MKWLTMTIIQDAMKDAEDSEMRGQVLENVCKYTAWQIIENRVCKIGRESVTNSTRCKATMVCQASKRTNIVGTWEIITHIDSALAPYFRWSRVLLDEFRKI